MTDAAPAEPRPEVVQAVHATGPEFGVLIELCEAAVAADGLHFVACYEGGVMAFSVNLLHEFEMPTHGGSLLTHRNPLGALERFGRQLNFVHGRLDGALAGVGSGRLIRIVIRLGVGAIFFYLVRPGEYLVSCSLNQDPQKLDDADSRTAKLATDIRGNLALGSQNPGGFATAGTVDLAAGFEANWQPVSRLEGAAPRDLVEMCEAAIKPDDVHYIAYFEDRRVVFSTDLLEHHSLARFFRAIRVEERRSRYAELGCVLHLRSEQLNNSLLVTLGGPIQQLVIDVEEGALYYFRLPDGAFLVGATLDQSRVLASDRVLRQLVESIARMSSPSAPSESEKGDSPA